MLTIKTIATIPPGKTVWDDGKGAVAGFGARRQKGDAVAYVLEIPDDGRAPALADHRPPWLALDAGHGPRRSAAASRRGREGRRSGRGKAGRAQGRDRRGALRRLPRGGEGRAPADAPEGHQEGVHARRRQGRIERHIKPLLGKLKVAAVTRQDVERFNNQVSEGATAARIKTGKHGLARVTGGRGTATRTMGLLGAIFTYAVRQGLRADNPVRGVERHAYEERQRRPSEAEYAALGEALRTMPETTWPVAVAAAKFLALTGWRRGEALALQWSEVDLGDADGAARRHENRLVAAPSVACGLRRAARASAARRACVSASVGVDKPMSGFHKIWLRIAAKAGLPADVTPHVLRHSFASVAADLGYSELTIAALIGHRKATVTSEIRASCRRRALAGRRRRGRAHRRIDGRGEDGG